MASWWAYMVMTIPFVYALTFVGRSGVWSAVLCVCVWCWSVIVQDVWNMPEAFRPKQTLCSEAIFFKGWTVTSLSYLTINYPPVSRIQMIPAVDSGLIQGSRWSFKTFKVLKFWIVNLQCLKVLEFFQKWWKFVKKSGNPVRWRRCRRPLGTSQDVSPCEKMNIGFSGAGGPLGAEVRCFLTASLNGMGMSAWGYQNN